ncbi:alkene reductase [Diaphorobacter sp. C33]|uniref:N-ethylmaleimide reductase n=1 Tax=Diaphorobacter nitroreducens TaxID=164759 RepID=A0AAX1WX01_9BURK|nr:alkene reductase [Diaphorobacter sp. C33]ROR49089.1 N-ethylmaleimide reductase [Diaphorobacter nitroreducens]WKK88948.1 alkene reductase [Diaphorobacter sp. C33]
MPTLFDPIQAGDLHLANRIAMAPLTRNRSPRAVPRDITATYYAQRASAGLLITEGTAITHQGQGYSDVPGLYSTEQLDGWKRVTQAVHARGGKIVTQLWHVGRVSHTALQPEGGAPVAPSAVRAQSQTYLVDPASGQGQFVPTSEPRALAAEELPDIVHAFAAAARNAVQTAGFDGVEIHGANGYLLDQFLKDGANQRKDDYGGGIANRVRLMVEVTRAVVDAIGGGRVGIRLSPVTPANDIRDSDPQPLFEHLARELAPLGLAFIHVIEGATGGPREVEGRPFDYAAFKNAYRSAGGRGAWMVNNGYDRDMAQEALASGRADIVAFGRAFISNPDLVERLRRGAPLNAWDKTTFYGGGEHGYIDYPALEQVPA